MDIHILQSSDIARAKKIWTLLEKELDYVPFNAEWNYIETWIDAFGKEVPHWFLYGEETGKACGIVLLVKEVGRDVLLPIKGFALGPDGENYTERVGMARNTILVKEKHKQQFVENVISTIRKEFQWEEINLDAFSDEDIKRIFHILHKMHIPYRLTKELAHVVDFGNAKEDGKDIYGVLEYNMRHRVRRSIKAFGDLEVEYALNLPNAKNIFNDLVTLHQESWKRRGKPGVFASKRVTAFHQKLIEKMFPQRKVSLVRVTSKRLGAIGCIYSYIDCDTVFAYQSGFADFTQGHFPDVNINRVKPGYITHALCMDECLKRGYRLYSFGPGHQIYKKEFANKTLELSSIHIRKGIKPKIRERILQEYIKMDNEGSVILKPLYALYTMMKR